MNNFIFKKKIAGNKKKYYLFGIQIYTKKIESEYVAPTIDMTTYFRLVPQNYLNLLTVNIIEHCNLNCINCSHFSSIAEEELLDTEEYRKDIKRIYELTEGKPHLISNIQLQGGEPLLHPQLTDFFAITREYFPDSDLSFVTNGILLNQQQEEFWLNCNKYNVKIAPTIYPINIKWDEIDDKAKKYNVMIDYGYVISETIEGKPKAIKTSWHWPMDLNGNKHPLYNFTHCNLGNNCVTLSHGRIFSCILPTGIKHFNKYFNKNLKITKADYIDIYKAKNLNEVLNFISKPFPFCRYCDVPKRTYGHKWACHAKSQTKNPISIKEWTL
mgnify:CR=1 FL=1